MFPQAGLSSQKDESEKEKVAEGETVSRLRVRIFILLNMYINIFIQ